MIICQCRVVSDRAVTRALDADACSLADVCRATGAAGDCGACVFAVKALVCQHQQETQALLEVEGAAS